MHNLDVRDEYQTLPVEDWKYEELLAWLIDEGAFSCGMETACTPEELLDEVLLQAEALDLVLVRR